MNQITQYKQIEFYGDTILCIEIEEGNEKFLYVPVKNLCQNLGIRERPQQIKIQQNITLKEGAMKINIPSAGGMQGTLCITHKLIPFWLATIYPNKIKNKETREKLILYQKEVADVLYKYFFEQQKVEKLNHEQIKLLRLQLLDKQLDTMQESPYIDQRYVMRQRQHIVAELTNQPIPEPEELNLSDYLEENGIEVNTTNLIKFGKIVANTYRKMRGKSPRKVPKMLSTGERLVNYYTYDDKNVIDRAFLIFRRQLTPKVKSKTFSDFI